MTSPRPLDRSAVLDRGLAVIQRWSVRLIAIALALYVLGWAIGHTWVIWFPVALATLFATVLAPPARWLREHNLPSAAAASIVMLGFLGVLGALVSVIIPQLVNELPEIANRASAGLAKIQTWLLEGPMPIEASQLSNAIDAIEDWLKQSATQISTGVLTTLGTALSVVINSVLVLMLTFFFIKDGHQFLPFLTRTTGSRVGTHIAEALNRTWGTLGGFIRTQGLVSLIDAVLIGVGLLIVDVPLAIPLAVLTFIGGFIPIIGAFVTGALAVLVTLVTNSPKDALIVLAIIVAVQQLEGNVLSPMLQGKSMNLHPAIVLLGVMAGGSMFGITGAFLAVPVVASVAELLRYISEQIDEASTTGALDPAGGPPEDPLALGPARRT